MLALTIKVGHSVKVGETTIHVVRLKPDGVILAFDAPDEVQIVRDDAKSKERKELSDTTNNGETK